jgi:XRE family transcriptional regulator, aerobic/anaerobic benzoate catabolism transcriptional regulator
VNDRTRESQVAEAQEPAVKTSLVLAFGERLRTLRARKGLTRRAVAQAADISERYLAQLESTSANPSLAILDQVARALECSIAELVGDVTGSSSEWLLIRELLEGRTESELLRARIALGQLFGIGGDLPSRKRRVALIGLRGAGKSTLGPMLAEDLELPFVELSREIERVAGYSVREIQDLYGGAAYRRYERRALQESIENYPELVLATPGGLVSDAATFSLLLNNCTTVWLQASPQDHMNRVALQGDFRPMAGSKEAMDDLKRILAGRSSFYSKATISLDTSRQPLHETFELLRSQVRQFVGLLDAENTA